MRFLLRGIYQECALRVETDPAEFKGKVLKTKVWKAVPEVPRWVKFNLAVYLIYQVVVPRCNSEENYH